jgi:hypothetical protein
MYLHICIYMHEYVCVLKAVTRVLKAVMGIVLMIVLNSVSRVGPHHRM